MPFQTSPLIAIAGLSLIPIQALWFVMKDTGNIRMRNYIGARLPEVILR
jgi:hypothetical protein